MTNLDQIVNQLNDETCEHSKRVGYYAYILSRQMGYTQSESKDNAIAAITHDLGKKDIDQEVLNKNGKLTEEEFAEIKRHPEAGYEALKSTNLDGIFTKQQQEKMLKVARYHHEKHNGMGYPHGLKGDEIPTEANLVCLVDAFDALTCERVYKKAWEVEDAKNWLIEQKNQMFKPSVVNAYEQAHEKIVLIKKHIEQSKEKINTNDFDREIEFILESKGLSFNVQSENITSFLSNYNKPMVLDSKQKRTQKIN